MSTAHTDYISAVYAANEREREAFAPIRADFIRAAARFLKAREMYWTQVEGASPEAARTQVRSERVQFTDTLLHEISSACAFGRDFDYLTGADYSPEVERALNRGAR